MDLDRALVHSIILGGESAYRAVLDKGIRQEIHLNGEGLRAWEYVQVYRREYGGLPSAAIIGAKLGLDLGPPPTEPAAFFADELLNRRLWHVLHEGQKSVEEKMKSPDPRAAFEIWTEIQRKVSREQVSLGSVESFLALGKELKKSYEEAKSGVRGIPAPWPTMDEQMMGWWPEDLILFVGRMGAGKSWVHLLCLHAAWAAKHKALLVSTEMSKIKMAKRFFALHLRVSYDDLRHGRLGAFIEKKFFEGVDEMLVDEGISIVGGGFDFTIDGVENAIDDCKPDIVLVDGAYLIKNSGKDRHEMVSNTFSDFKRIGKRRQLAIIANSQFNRSAKSGQEATIAAENVAISDVPGWNADGMFGLVQTDDMRSDNLMGLKSLKIREGRPMDLKSNWNLTTMDFSEVGQTPTPGSPSSSPSDGPDDLEDIPF